LRSARLEISSRQKNTCCGKAKVDTISAPNLSRMTFCISGIQAFRISRCWATLVATPDRSDASNMAAPSST
jgi:hypothetical protein